MRQLNNLTFTLILAATVAVLFVATAIPMVGATEDKSGNPQQEQATRKEPEEAGRSTLDGAKVYAWNCGACHSERYPKERTDAEWGVIITHMRVRANLTADQAQAVLRYLVENNE